MKTKTISHLKGLAFWRAFFKLPISGKRANYDIAEERARSWNSCACCDLINKARHTTSLMGPSFWSPANPMLEEMGSEFWPLIDERKYARAHKLFLKIQPIVRRENAKV